MSEFWPIVLTVSGLAISGLFGRAVFKGEMRPVGIGLDRRRMSEQAAEIDEVFLASGALIKFDVSPFIDEGLRRESNQRKSP